jgi:hypothetical protein
MFYGYHPARDLLSDPLKKHSLYAACRIRTLLCQLVANNLILECFIL